MKESVVLLLGDISHEGVTSFLSTAKIHYKGKRLDSTKENWGTTVGLFNKFNVKLVLAKFTSDTYGKLASQEYEFYVSQLLKNISRVPHRIFVYEGNLRRHYRKSVMRRLQRKAG